MVNERLNKIVGVLMLMVVVAALGAVLLFAGRPLRPVVHFTVIFERVGQLEPGAPIKIANMTVGRVTSITFAKRKPQKGQKSGEEGVAVRVSVWVKTKYKKHVRKNSRFFVSSVSLIGQRHLEIAPPDNADLEREIRSGDVVYGISPPHLDRMLQMTYDNLTASVELINSVKPVLGVVRSRLNSVQRKVDDYLTEKTRAKHIYDLTVTSYDEAVALKKAIDWSTEKGKRFTRLERKLKRLERRIRLRIERDEATIKDLRSQIDDASKGFTDMHVKKKLRRVRAVLERIEAEGKLMRRLLKSVQRAVDLGMGTVGAFMKDKEIFDDFKDTQKTLKYKPWSPLAKPKKMSPQGYPTP